MSTWALVVNGVASLGNSRGLLGSLCGHDVNMC